MIRDNEKKFILVERETRLDELTARYNTIGQARFYVEHLGADFGEFEREHMNYRSCLDQVESVLSAAGRVHVLHRTYLPNFMFGSDDIVVVVGPDGLVANTMKYLDGQSVIGINSDPERWDGKLLPFELKELESVVPQVIGNERYIRDVTMAQVTTSDRQTLFAVNDLFIGQRTHVSARYQIQSGNRSEHQSSSGIIVSTGLGSSGWLKSVIAGASGIMGQIEGGTGRSHSTSIALPWDTDQLIFSVREPFPSKTTGTGMVYGTATRKKPLVIRSYMGDGGIIFSDGIESDFLTFNSGMEATVTIADRIGRLVV